MHQALTEEEVRNYSVTKMCNIKRPTTGEPIQTAVNNNLQFAFFCFVSTK